MKKREYILLYLLAVLFFGILSTFQKIPGYMDAEYYFSQSVQLATGQGFYEPFIWNYLNNPLTIPAPAFGFWMPFTSIIGAVGMFILQTHEYYASRLLFILLAGLAPVISAYFAEEFLPDKHSGWIAGGFAIFSGLYFPYITLTETFTPYMVLGGVFFVIFYKMLTRENRVGVMLWPVLLGLVIGLMNLTRSDGLLWIAGGVLAILIYRFTKKTEKPQAWAYIKDLSKLALGYLIIMLPWFMRNYSIYHSIFPSGNSYVLWLTNYEDLFTYPVEKLTFIKWSQTGIANILVSRLNAFGTNLQTLVAVGGGIILFPLIGLGVWARRKHQIIRIFAVMLVALLGLMSIVFPYAGARGGFFHSLASLQVILWSVIPVGLEIVINWAVKNRKWEAKRSWKLFGSSLVVVMCIFSVIVFIGKLSKGPDGTAAWNNTQDKYIEVDNAIVEKNNDEIEIAMVNNPPGYSLATGRETIVIPVGGIESIISAAIRYNARYIIIDNDRQTLKPILSEQVEHGGIFSRMVEIGDVQVYEIKQ